MVDPGTFNHIIIKLINLNVESVCLAWFWMRQLNFAQPLTRTKFLSPCWSPVLFLALFALNFDAAWKDILTFLCHHTSVTLWLLRTEWSNLLTPLISGHFETSGAITQRVRVVGDVSVSEAWRSLHTSRQQPLCCGVTYGEVSEICWFRNSFCLTGLFCDSLLSDRTW